MFTGLVREIGRVVRMTRRGGVATIEVEGPRVARPADRTAPAAGDSVSVNGVCLTVVGIEGARLFFEATAETRRVSSVDDWRTGTLVHLERSLRVGDEIGGHFVSGHVDGTGRLTRLARRGRSATMTVSVPRHIATRLLPKKSIAVDGVSLTLEAGPFDHSFTVTLIPHTLGATRFAQLAAGSRLNLELDVLSNAAERTEARAPLTIGAIRNRGWK